MSSRQIHRLTQIQVDKARPIEVVVPAPGVAAGPHYKVSIAKGEQVIIDPTSLRRRPDGSTSLTLEKADHTAIEETPFGLDKSRREYDEIIKGDDKSAAVKAQRKLSKATKTMADPTLVMRNGRPCIVKRKTRWLADGGCLWVKVMPSQTDPDGCSKSYVFRYSLPEQVTSANGKTYQRQRHHGIGSCNVLRLDEAREVARQLRRDLALHGTDPITAKRAKGASAKVAEKKLKTWDIVMSEFLINKGDAWSKVHHHNWVQSMRDHISPIIGGIPVSAVDTELAIRALTDLHRDHPVTAARVMGRCADVYSYAVLHGHAAEPNPFRYKGHLEFRFPQRTDVTHLPALPFAKMPSLWGRLVQVEGLASLALQWTTLTVARTGETLAALASEIDWERQLWRVPKLHLKNRRHMADDDFIQPLTDEAMAVLAKLGRREPGERLFPLARGMLDVLQGIHPDVTVHGTTRGAFKTWSEEATDTDSKVVEACMSHKVGTAVDLAYHRGPQFIEKKRRHLTMWANYVTGRTATADVIPMAGRRA
jgi:integrase